MIKAILRAVVFYTFYFTPFVQFTRYSHRDTMQTSGYQGWWDFLGVCIAFEHLEGGRQFQW